MATDVTSISSPTEKEPELTTITELLGNVDLDDTKPSALIDTDTALSKVIDALSGLPTQPPSIYVDLEEILESKDIPKVFFDVRNDSDALFSHFKINLRGILDLQLMELATRTFARRHVNGLAKCIERDCPLSALESNTWKNCKEQGVNLFAPERGGSYKVFNKRPLDTEIVNYCIQDVAFMPRLWSVYSGKITPEWLERVKLSSLNRVKESQSSEYISHGQHKALAPKGWGYL